MQSLCSTFRQKLPARTWGFWIAVLVYGGGCGGSSSRGPETTEPAEQQTAAGYEETSSQAGQSSAISIGAPTELDQQPIQPEEVPTPIEGVLGNQWQCSGEVDAGRLQSQLDAAAADFRACFVEAMLTQRISKVDVRLIARVDQTGKVTDEVVRSTPTLSQSIACSEGVLRGLRFVRPRGGDCVVLDYPLRFSISH